MAHAYLASPFSPDWEALVQCIRRQGTPRRVHNIELFLDAEVQEAVCRYFGLLDGLDSADPYFTEKRQIRIQRFLGYDYVRAGAEGLDMPLHRILADDTAELRRQGGRRYLDEHTGPITTWAEFEAFPWPSVAQAGWRSLEWYQRNLPDDMCLVGYGLFGHFAEYVTWLMGYETLCYALYEQRDLVQAICNRVLAMSRDQMAATLHFDRIKLVWGSDDMGFNTSTMISPADLREFVLPGHKLMADMAHAAGCPYLLHACGNLREIMPDLIDDVRIDAKHSFEDVIEPVTEAKAQYGDRLALLGGIDLDFLCRADEQAIRRRVRRTLDACQPGGGYVLGTGNSVANYIPLAHYLAMLDEGRLYSPQAA